VVSTPDSDLARVVEHEICVVVGPEIIAGSTRLKAGTAQKLVLNTLSTAAMVRLGKTYGNLMIDGRGRSEKLRARTRRAVELAAGVTADEADEALEAAGGRAKVAVVSLLAGIDVPRARARLERCRGNIRAALAP
jgi:N-acetylmuramic acid 6-phosphate etherase